MKQALILQPLAAMMLLSLAVWLRLYFTRIPALRERRVDPQSIATRAQRTQADLGGAEARSSDNFVNLFELPVLFYALCLVLYVTERVDTVYLALLWGFFALRVVHSVIHLTYNKVVHRFLAYAAGGALLFSAVLRFSLQAFFGEL